jgi:citrate lyase subunit beta/citryl-CoA lyase
VTGPIRRPLRSWLYAPGNQPRLLEKVFSVGADAVILDLEDAVPAAEKDRALALVTEAVRKRAGHPGPAVFVRVNHPDSGLTAAEIAAVVGPGLDGLRLPKIESPGTVAAIDVWITAAEREQHLQPGRIPLVCNIETAAGVWSAREIAAASSRILGLAFGPVDFARDVQAADGVDGREMLYARSHLVIASRVAGIGAPIEGVYTRLDDTEGLERSTRQARALGFFGRSALHPRQVPIINAVFTPTPDEVARARAIVEAARVAEQTGHGAVRLPNGDFVDLPVVSRAEATLQLADSLADAGADTD